MNPQPFTWQENALLLLTVPTAFMLALLISLGIVKVAKWWNR